MANAGTVTITLDAKTAKLLKALKKADDSAKRHSAKMRKNMVRNFKAISKKAALMGAGLVASFAAAARGSIASADKIGKTAKVIGVSAEALQELRFAAAQSGVEARGLDDSLRRMQRRMGEFINSGAGPAQKALEGLGIEITDAGGKFIGTEAAFSKVVQAMGKMESTAERSAVAAQLFGDDFGPKLVTLTDQGVDGIDALRKEARDLGGVISNEAVASAEEAEDAFNRLSTTVSQRFIKAFAENADTITDTADAFTVLAIEAFDAANEMLRFFGIGKKNKLEKDLEEINNIISAMEQQDGFMLKFSEDTHGKTLEEMKADAAILRGELAALNNGRSLERFQRDKAPTTETPSGTFSGFKSDDKEYDSLIAKYATAEQKAASDLADIAAQAVAIRSELGEDLGNADINRMVEEVYAGLEESGNKAKEEMASIAEGITEATRTPIEQWKISMDEARAALDEGFITPDVFDRYNRMLSEGLVEPTKEAAEEMSEHSKQAARNIQDAFARFLFDPFDDGLKGMLEGFLNAIREMLANQLATQIFGGSGGGGLGGFFASMFGGGMASGGSAAAGQTYLVGEQGPELLTMGSNSGVVTPNHKLETAGGVSNYYSFEAGADVATIMAEVVPMIEMGRQAAVSDVFGHRSRGEL